MNWEETIAERLEEIRSLHRWREPKAFDAFGPHGTREGVAVTSFASNDYLGLSSHPAVIAAASEASTHWGTGATAARLIVGSRPIHHELEHLLATYHGTEAAALFSTGYQANLGVLGALGTSETFVYSDELNHASIVDGIRLSRAQKRIYSHGDMAKLATALATDFRDHPSVARIIVSDVVFSMDGDLAPIQELFELAATYHCFVILDVAHLVLDHEKLNHLIAHSSVPVALVGTLSKTFGSQGGYVCGSRKLIALIENTARSYIFTTALAPAAAAAAYAALCIVRSPEGASLRQQLRSNIDLLAKAHPSPIIPIPCVSEQEALRRSSALFEHGMLVPAIRPPTVPADSCRLRVAVSAIHTESELLRLKDQLTSSESP